MKTKIIVEFFKPSGKFYSSFNYESEIECWNIEDIKHEVQKHDEYLSMTYTIEVKQINPETQAPTAWNKYLFIR